MADFLDSIQDIVSEGIPVNVKVDVPIVTLIILGVVLFAAILLSQVLAGIIVAKAT